MDSNNSTKIIEASDWKRYNEGGSMQNFDRRWAEQEIKKAKKGGRMKMLASFGVGSFVGGAAVGTVSYFIIKALLKSWLPF
jgi:hypothetical protein